MSEAGPHGPQVDAGEDLFRAITVPDWWDFSVDPPRVRSFAFKVDAPFSVNRASLMTLEHAVNHMRDVLHSPDGGIVQFNCGKAREVGFDAREELDPNDPENFAHANVYYEGSKKRKREAKRLAELSQTVHEPQFAE